MSKNIPANEQQFDALMIEIDKELANNGLTISQRPINAVITLARKYHLPLPLTPPISGVTHKSFQYWHITDRIYKWFDNRYSGRLEVHFGPGRMAFLIDHDIWVFRFPKLFGKHALVAHLTLKSGRSENGESAIYNILESIEGLPDGLRSSLNENQLAIIYNDFLLGFYALDGLKRYSSNGLIKSSLADISSAVDNLLLHSPEYGLSKWSSLQAAEKLIKASIEWHGKKYTKTHNLNKLVNDAAKSGIVLEINNEINQVQCSPAIRYGEIECGKEEAVKAHHAVFRIALAVIQSLS